MTKITSNSTLGFYEVINLGIIPGFQSGRAMALNDRGQVIGTLNDTGDENLHSFLWSEGRMTNLGSVFARHINNKGQIVGKTVGSNWLKYSAFIHTAGRTSRLMKHSQTSSMADCLNDAGQIVGHMMAMDWKSPSGSNWGAFFWEDGKRHYLNFPDGYRRSEAAFINTPGQIVGNVWNDNPSDCHAVLWENNQVVLLEEPPGYNTSKAVAINNGGDVLIKAFQNPLLKLTQSWTDEKQRGTQKQFSQEDFDVAMARFIAEIEGSQLHFYQKSFLWHKGKMLELDGLATALNDHSQVIGWSGCDLSDEALARSDWRPYACLWEEGKEIDLNTCIPPESGWQLTRANGINNQGQIVGHGKYQGKTCAFLLTPTTK